MINTIRGIVEIKAEKEAKERDRAERDRDRDLQTTIAVVGVGGGVSGLAGSCYPYLIAPDPQTKTIPLELPSASSTLHPFVWAMLWSIILGLVGALIAEGVTMLIWPESNRWKNGKRE